MDSKTVGKYIFLLLLLLLLLQPLSPRPGPSFFSLIHPPKKTFTSINKKLPS